MHNQAIWGVSLRPPSCTARVLISPSCYLPEWLPHAQEEAGKVPVPCLDDNSTLQLRIGALRAVTRAWHSPSRADRICTPYAVSPFVECLLQRRGDGPACILVLAVWGPCLWCTVPVHKVACLPQQNTLSASSPFPGLTRGPLCRDTLGADGFGLCRQSAPPLLPVW